MMKSPVGWPGPSSVRGLKGANFAGGHRSNVAVRRIEVAFHSIPFLPFIEVAFRSLVRPWIWGPDGRVVWGAGLSSCNLQVAGSIPVAARSCDLPYHRGFAD